MAECRNSQKIMTAIANFHNRWTRKLAISIMRISEIEFQLKAIFVVVAVVVVLIIVDFHFRAYTISPLSHSWLKFLRTKYIKYLFVFI